MVCDMVFVVEKKDMKGGHALLFICQTLDGAVSKIKEHVKGDPSWQSRYDGTIWNNGSECIVVTQHGLEA